MRQVDQGADEQDGVYQTVENLPIAASLQKVQTLLSNLNRIGYKFSMLS